jgi:hypothetical protein
VFILRFSLTGSLGCWLGVHYRRNGGVFYFADFSVLIGFEDVGCGGFFGGPEGQI